MDEKLLHEQTWRRLTRRLYYPVLANVVTAVAIVVLSVVFVMLKGPAALASGQLYAVMSGQGGGFLVLAIVVILSIGSLVIYAVAVWTLNALREEVDIHDQQAVLMLFIAMTAQIPVSFFSGQVVLAGVLQTGIYALMLYALWKLKGSPTFPERARQGMAKLFWAVVNGMAGVILALIVMRLWVVAGGVLLLLAAGVVMVMSVLGMRDIAHSEAPELRK